MEIVQKLSSRMYIYWICVVAMAVSRFPSFVQIQAADFWILQTLTSRNIWMATQTTHSVLCNAPKLKISTVCTYHSRIFQEKLVSFETIPIRISTDQDNEEYNEVLHLDTQWECIFPKHVLWNLCISHWQIFVYCRHTPKAVNLITL
jgi:hypothetical protein